MKHLNCALVVLAVSVTAIPAQAAQPCEAEFQQMLKADKGRAAAFPNQKGAKSMADVIQDAEKYTRSRQEHFCKTRRGHRPKINEDVAESLRVNITRGADSVRDAEAKGGKNQWGFKYQLAKDKASLCIALTKKVECKGGLSR